MERCHDTSDNASEELLRQVAESAAAERKRSGDPGDSTRQAKPRRHPSRSRIGRKEHEIRSELKSFDSGMIFLQLFP